MASDPIVFFIHTKHGCPYCNDLVQPKKFQEFTQDILTVYPNIQFRIVNHSDWVNTNKSDDYPRFNSFPTAPMFAVTSLENASVTGDPRKVHVWSCVWSESYKGYLKIEGYNVPMKKWLKDSIDKILAKKGKNMDQSMYHSPQGITPPVQPSNQPVFPRPFQQQVDQNGDNSKDVMLTKPPPRKEENGRRCNGFTFVSITPTNSK